MPSIKLTFPDGSTKEVESGIKGSDVASAIGPRLAKDALAMKVHGNVQELSRPITRDSPVQILTWKDQDGKNAFWHSTAHVLAHAISRLYPEAKNTIGPPIENGFFYDFDNLNITPEDFPKIEAEMQKIVQADFPFERKEWTIDDVRAKQNQYKVELAEKFEAGHLKLTAYKDGEFIDLCEGSHVPSTGKIKAFKLLKISSAYWKGDQDNQQLTRIYGIGFPSKKELDEWLTLQEELAKRDHRKIGKEQELFMFHEWSPGSPFLLPKGTVIYNELLNFIRDEYRTRGYEEVITPQLFNKKLWEQSGHWTHFKENMFCLEVDHEEFSLKPMNCPSHCLMFKNKSRSYRDLPWRVADFTPLHRNELKGVLTGLTRVRKMAQDDAHVFCTPEQVQDEIHKLLHFVKHVYVNVFGMDVVTNLSTKPEKALGSPELWEQAEQALKSALDKAGVDYVLKEGEGAFYGPKIDFDVKDALGRLWQTATIQLDFQMPERFELKYIAEDNTQKQPVMIHRAILGSLERFMGILIEHYAGRFPLWLSPEQVRILTIADRHNEYAEKVRQQLHNAGIRAKIDSDSETLNKKVREAQVQQVNYILVIGDKEAESGAVNVRTRENEVKGEIKVEDFIKELKKEIEEKR